MSPLVLSLSFISICFSDLMSFIHLLVLKYLHNSPLLWIYVANLTRTLWCCFVFLGSFCWTKQANQSINQSINESVMNCCKCIKQSSSRTHVLVCQGQGFDAWLVQVAGEVDPDWVVANDHVREVVLVCDGVRVDDPAIVELQDKILGLCYKTDYKLTWQIKSE